MHYIAMVDLGLKSRLRKRSADFIRNHYRAVLTTGTAEGDCQVTLSLHDALPIWGRHRSVMIADEVRRSLADSGFKAKVNHRDIVGAA